MFTPWLSGRMPRLDTARHVVVIGGGLAGLAAATVLAERGARVTLLGVPAWALLAFLSDNQDQVSVPFTVNGCLANPRFSAQQSRVDEVD